MAIFNVASQTELNAAITTITGRGSTDVINFTASFTLSGNLTPLFLVAGENLTINGNGYTMNGANTFGGFVIQNGTVAINDLDILNTTARGGNGGTIGGNGSGGGAGLGGGLFVGAGASVTITDVDFTGARAIGGNGGHWNGAYAPGGLWNGFLGAIGPSFGGGGNGAASASTRYVNIDGGFGAGGGGITNYIGGPHPEPGNGGYGAGGGGKDLVDSTSGGGGGGGLGAGGAIFVDTLGTLTIGGGTISGGAVQGGAAGNSAPNPIQFAGGGGSAGSGIFLHGATVTFTPAAGQTSTISDTIHQGDGTGGIVMRGAGTLQLGGANLFSGGVAVYSGTLSLGNATSAGSGLVDFAGYGTLRLAAGVNIANTIKNFGLSDTIVLAGFGAATGISFNVGTKILTVTNASGSTETFHFHAAYAYAGNQFVATVDANGNTTLKIANLLTDSDFKMVDLTDTGPGVAVNHTIGNTLNGVLTGWTGTGAFGGFAPTTVASTGFAGSNVGYVNAGGSVSQTISGDFDSYRLELDLGSRLDSGNGSSVRVEIFVGSTVIRSQTYDTSAASQGLGTVTHKVLDTITPDPGQKGLPVRVVISNLGGSQLLFDNVVLTGTDTTAPIVTSALANDAGASNADNITNVATLTGTGDANAIVRFTVDGNAIPQTATANTAGVWTFTPTGLSNGQHTIVASETDAGGNTGTASLTFTLDASAPSVTIGTVAGNDRVSAAEGATGFTVGGTTSGVEDNQSVTVTLNGHSYFAQVTSNAWSLTVPATDAIADGPYTITANVSDVAGNAANQATRAIIVNETIAASSIVDRHLAEATDSTAGTATATATITIEAGSSYDSTALASAGWTYDAGSNLWSQVSTYGTAILDTTAGTVVFHLDDAAANALRATDHPAASFLVPLVDTDGNTGSTLVTFTIDGANDAPVATNDSYTTGEDTPLVIDAAAGVLANDADVEGDALSAVVVTGPAHGTLTLDANGSLSYTPDADYNGADSFTYKAADGGDDSNVATVDITVTPANDTPVATNDSYATGEGTPLVIAAAAGVLTNDGDIDNDPLSAILVTGPTHGTLTLNADGSLSYVADENYNGPDSFTYKANDGAEDSNAATVDITVTAVNDAPIAASDGYTIGEDTPLVIAAAAGVLANDSDIENDALSAVVVTGPTHGTLILNANGSLSYTADADYNGTDSFTYKAGDGTDDSNIATVEITVTAVNDAPVAANDSYAIGEDTPLVIAAAAGLLANDSDIDNDALSAILVTGPTHGTLTLNADGSLSYVADENYNGPDSFTYKANDGAENSNVATVDITVTAVNDAPMAANDSYTAGEDTPLVIAAAAGLLANDSDIENDSLSAVLVTGPAHGTLTLNADGSLSYIADADYNGPDNFTYKANAGAADSDAARVDINITAVNDAPAAANDSYTIGEDTPLVIAAADGLLANDSDIDNDALSAILVTGPAHGTLTVNADGSLSYTADENYNGPDSFTYKANDGAEDTNVATVDITVTAVNDAPVATNNSYSTGEDTTLVIGAAAGVLANDSDIENDSLSALLVSGPAHGTLTLNADGSLSYTADANYNGADSFTYEASDGAAVSNVATVGITVTAVDDAPAAAADAFSANEATPIGSGLSVFANNGHGADRDIDGPALSVSAVNGVAGNVGALITLSSGALLRLNADGTFRYDPHGAFDYLPGAGSGASNLNATDSFNYTLAGGGTATVTIRLRGLDSAGDLLVGTAGNNFLNGGIGADTMRGGAGNDVYVVDSTGDKAIEALDQGTDTVQSRVSLTLAANIENLTLINTAAARNGTGNSLGNIITGNDFANVLNGATGTDRLAGGKGNDIYVTDGRDAIVEAFGQGADTVQSRVSLTLAANVENLTLANLAAALNGTGNSLDNILTGNDYANVLNGTSGADRLAGGKGNDIYVTDGQDTILEAFGQGTDTVQSRVSLLLAANVENLTLINTATARNGTGNSLANTITGNDYANVLNGATGTDRLAGGKGNDIYVTDGRDAIVEAFGQGTDTVQSRVSLTLAANLENLVLINMASALNGTGNGIDNTITGNDYANSLHGGGGSDTLLGGAGDDWLAGGSGKDNFVFNTVPFYGNRDTIIDFNSADDTIQLENAIFGMGAGILHSHLFFIGNAAHDRDDRIIYHKATGALYYDSDGNRSNEQVQFATIANLSDLASNDFVLI